MIGKIEDLIDIGRGILVEESLLSLIQDDMSRLMVFERKKLEKSMMDKGVYFFFKHR